MTAYFIKNLFVYYEPELRHGELIAKYSEIMYRYKDDSEVQKIMKPMTEFWDKYITPRVEICATEEFAASEKPLAGSIADQAVEYIGGFSLIHAIDLFIQVY